MDANKEYEIAKRKQFFRNLFSALNAEEKLRKIFVFFGFH